MKVCAFCESLVEDTATSCPNCSANRFKTKCPRCGKAYEGPACPDCQAHDKAAQEAAEQARLKTEAEEKANSGLGWKTVLTFFMPYIGGYFLVKPEVKTGFRYFGIIWCVFIAITAGMSHNELVTKLLGGVLSLGPLAVYAMRQKAWNWKDSSIESKAIMVVCAIALIVSVGSAIAGGDNPRPQSTSTVNSVSTSSTTDATAPTSSSSTDDKEAKAQAEAEAQAKAEAEAKAKAEEEAKAKAEAEAKKKEEAAAKKEAEKQKKIDDLEAYFPSENAYRAATVALTNSLADDVFTPDNRDAANPALFHSYSDHSGYWLKSASSGTWSYKDDSTWHADGIEYLSSYNSDIHIKVSLDVQFDGLNYTVTNVRGKQYKPGYPAADLSLDNWESESGTPEAFTVSPDMVS